MKTIFTLVAFSLISSLAFAGEKHPSVTVSSTGEYVIVVDGKRFDNEKRISLAGLQKGKHYIDVFKKRKGLFGSKYKLISSKEFELGNKDLLIDVNFSGYITIGKQEKGWDGDHWWNNRNKNRE
jgi:hypothetical protein